MERMQNGADVQSADSKGWGPGFSSMSPERKRKAIRKSLQKRKARNRGFTSKAATGVRLRWQNCWLAVGWAVSWADGKQWLREDDVVDRWRKEDKRQRKRRNSKADASWVVVQDKQNNVRRWVGDNRRGSDRSLGRSKMSENKNQNV